MANVEQKIKVIRYYTPMIFEDQMKPIWKDGWRVVSLFVSEYKGGHLESNAFEVVAILERPVDSAEQSKGADPLATPEMHRAIQETVQREYRSGGGIIA